jgi:hypothetical protein
MFLHTHVQRLVALAVLGTPQRKGTQLLTCIDFKRLLTNCCLEQHCKELCSLAKLESYHNKYFGEKLFVSNMKYDYLGSYKIAQMHQGSYIVGQENHFHSLGII